MMDFLFFCLCQNETLIAIKAPHGTTLEVPEPDEVCLYECILFSSKILLENSIDVIMRNLAFSCFMFQALDCHQKRYRIILRSTMGPIDVYLVRYSINCFTNILHYS